MADRTCCLGGQGRSWGTLSGVTWQELRDVAGSPMAGVMVVMGSGPCRGLGWAATALGNQQYWTWTERQRPMIPCLEDVAQVEVMAGGLTCEPLLHTGTSPPCFSLPLVASMW